MQQVWKKRTHTHEECTTDLAKVKCFAYGEHGHISARCPKSSSKGPSKGSPKGSSSKGSKGEKGAKGPGSKGKTTSKGKGKGKKGKKGKMFEGSAEGQQEFSPGIEEWGGEDWWGAEGWGETWEQGWGSGEWSQTGATQETENLQLSALLLDEDSHVFACECTESSPALARECHNSEDSHVSGCELCLGSHVKPLFVHGIHDGEHAEWWLLDNCASVTVLSEQHAEYFGVNMEQTNATFAEQQFSSANGTPVVMHRACKLDVLIELEDPLGECRYSKATMPVLVGNMKHNILSTTSLCCKGWHFQQGPEKIHLWTEKGQSATDLTLFANVPCLRLKPVQGSKVLCEVKGEVPQEAAFLLLHP